jgi:tripartite-type tricarboxylate transporter receptor subunit TctC
MDRFRGSEKIKNPSKAAKTIRDEDIIDPSFALMDLYPMVSNTCPVAPKTPEAIISKMSAILIKMADDPEVKEAMRKLGASTVKSTPDQFVAQIKQEMAQWKPLIAEIAEKK